MAEPQRIDDRIDVRVVEGGVTLHLKNAKGRKWCLIRVLTKIEGQDDDWRSFCDLFVLKPGEERRLGINNHRDHKHRVEVYEIPQNPDGAQDVIKEEVAVA